MSSSTLDSPSTAEQQAAVENDHYIRGQLNRTRRQVKIVELVSGSMAVGSMLLAALLCLALIDHWIFPLGPVTRLVASLLLAMATLYGLARLIGPLLFRSINPIYAARSIEQQSPALKNSLINFLLLRSQPQALRRGMLAALSQQAATDLLLPDVDTNVDRSRLITIGYLFAAILACCGLYKVLSPKDPFQSFQRVIIPWAKIDQPSRVAITNVQPGHVNGVYQGQVVTVTADVRNLQDDEPVYLVYESMNGQISDQRVVMQGSEASSNYQAELPQETVGIQQDMQYYVQAGDHRTPSYRLTVIPAPTIWVNRVEYEYPAYTKIPRRIVARQGDLEALEGTQVTIHAETNQPIERASAVMATAQNPDAQWLRMASEKRDASLAMRMELDDTGQAPRYHSYRLEFTTKRGHASEHPVVHRIQVIRDLPPEIEILRPQEKRTEVPVTAVQTIEVRALDPDFGLTRIAVRSSAGETRLLERTLFEQAEGQPGQVIRRYRFEPRRLGLKPGDEVILRAVAWDNRHSSQGILDAQEVRTDDYTLVITAGPAGNQLPDESPRGKDDDPNQPSPGDGEQGGNDGGSGNAQQAGGEADGSQGGNAEESSSEGNGKPDAGDPGSQEPNGKTPGTNEAGGQSNSPRTPPGNSSDSDNQEPGTNQQAGTGANNENPGEANNQNPSGDEAPGGDDPHDGEVFERVLDRIKRERKQASRQEDETTPSNDPDSKSGDEDTSPDSAGSNDGNQADQGTPPGGQEGASQPPGNQPGKTTPTPDGQQAPGNPANPTAGSQAGEKPGDKPKNAAGDGKPSTPTDTARQGEQGKDGNKPGTSAGGKQDPAQPRDTENTDDKGKPSPGTDETSTDQTGDSDTGSPGKQPQESQSGKAGTPQGQSTPTNQDPGKKQPQGDGESSGPPGTTSPTDAPGQAGNRGSDEEGQGTDQQVSGGPRQGDSDRLLGLPDDLPDSDEANLDYAKKATDLVLDYLKNQQHDPDPDLLKELGLTADELREMVNRYEKIRTEARKTGEQAELDETLRSLGLRPSSRRRARRTQSARETPGGLNEDGSASNVPSRFRQQFDAFRKSTSRAGN